MTKTKGRKGLIIGIMAVALVGVLMAGLTMAYLTDQRETLNVLSIGQVKIALYEEAFADQAIAARGDDSAVTVMNPGEAEEYSVITLDNVVPGQPVNKDPKVDNLSPEDVYIRVQLLDDNDDPIDLEAEPYSRMGIQLASGWVVGADGFLYYTTALAPSAAAVPVFLEQSLSAADATTDYAEGTAYTMMLPADLTNDDIDDDVATKFSQLVNLKLVAQAVQARGFDPDFSAPDTTAPWPSDVEIQAAARTTTP